MQKILACSLLAWTVALASDPSCFTSALALLDCANPLSIYKDISYVVKDDNGTVVESSTMRVSKSMTDDAIWLSLRHRAWTLRQGLGPVRPSATSGKSITLD